jgi:oligopeptidase A
MSASFTENPLLGLASPTGGAASRDERDIPFDRVRAEHVEPGIAKLSADARAQLDAFANDDGPRTFDRTMLALEAIGQPVGEAMGVVAHLESTATTPELRASYNAVQAPVSELFSAITLSSGVWSQLRAYAETPEARALTGTRKRFVAKTLDDFRRNGAELDAAGKERLAAIDAALAETTAKFAQNVLDATNAFELFVDDERALAGLPKSAMEAARESAASRSREGWRFTLQAPSYFPAMTYLDDARIRETLFRAFSGRASSGANDNRGVVARILELRREKARLLGYATFADLILADRMAKTGAEARRFVAELREKSQAAFERENAELAKFAGRKLAPWDVTYWAEKQRLALYDFDDEALRPYFAADAVIAGVFDVAARLYGVRVEPREGAPVWHPSVRAYGMRDASGRAIATFYLDLFPRESKIDGAWMHGVRNGVGGERHVALVCANLSPPIAGRPSLLTHREVETIFHEFGHLLHHCLSDVEIRSLSGTHVATDFVELPSRIMENWCWERDVLDGFARHYETGAPIDGAVFDRMRRARTYRGANALMRQLGFAAVDLALHCDYEAARDGDLFAYARRVMQDYAPAPFPDDYAMIASFSHLFSDSVGYAAGYYSYSWAAVLDADAFTRFAREGLLSAGVGDAFRRAILSRGNSEDPAALYREFMGRDPKLEALLERTGLL